MGARDDAADPFAAAGDFRGGWIGWLGYDHAARTAGAPAFDDETIPSERGMEVDRFVAVDHASRRLWAWAPRDAIADFVEEVQGWRGARHDGGSAPDKLRIDGGPPAVEARGRHTPAAYAALIEACRDRIRDGDAYQLCLTTRFSVDGPVDPVAVYLRLRALTPAHHGGLLKVGPHALASASPEQFLELAHGVVRTRPIKGTRPRAARADDDARMVDELREAARSAPRTS